MGYLNQEERDVRLAKIQEILKGNGVEIIQNGSTPFSPKMDALLTT